jgi:hypothetical protein
MNKLAVTSRKGFAGWLENAVTTAPRTVLRRPGQIPESRKFHPGLP